MTRTMAAGLIMICLAPTIHFFASMHSAHTSDIKAVFTRLDAMEQPPDPYDAICDYIRERESAGATVEQIMNPGPRGELGPWQVTPIWIADIERLFGEKVDPFDAERTRRHVRLWLKYYAPRAGAETKEDMHELYRMGLTGYRRWKGGE